ncbi:metabotropic glutamate receptor-like [Haliotis asinina]|uniref:metabotropic glutamate receptor-like n=1 Tax=Haliotis asinina TaxID=109174 RepID=UPI0035325A49
MGALQRVEAVAFAVGEVNGRKDILPNVTLGFTMMDDCSKDTTALVRALHLIQNNIAGIVIVTVDIFTILVTIIVTAFYIKNNKKKLIKASSRELSYLMLGGIFLSCVFVALLAIRPTNATCNITYVGFHLSFTLTYAPLTVKTNRIYRIFTAGKKSSKRPPFIDSKSQILFTVIILILQVDHAGTCCVGPDIVLLEELPLTVNKVKDVRKVNLVDVSFGRQIALDKHEFRSAGTVIIGIWIILDTPRALTAMPNFSERYVEVTCKLPETGFLVSVVCNLTLVLVCTFYAMKTRKLPDNFNESRFVSFCVYTTIVLWLAFIPTYFTTTKTTLRSLFLAAAMAANSNVILFFLYVPKLYALYYVSTEAQNLALGTSMPVATSSRSQRVGITKVLPVRP